MNAIFVGQYRVCCWQGRTDTVAPVALATVNFPSESSIVVYRKACPVSRETLAAYSLQNGISYQQYNSQITIFDSSSFYFFVTTKQI